MSRELQKPEPSVQPPHPGPHPAPVHRHKTIEEIIHEAEEETFFRQHRGLLITAAVVVIGLAVYFFPKPRPGSLPRPPEHLVMIQPLAPPTPRVRPPPPPPQKAPPPEKMEKAAAPEEEVQPKNVAPPPQAALATGLKGSGPGVGLASSGNGIGGGNVIGSNGGGGRNWGPYTSQVRSKIAAALSTNARTRKAVFGRLEVRIWPDATGRIVQAKLASSTGDPALDDAIQNQVLNGLQLSEAPPAGMPLPIVLAVSAKR